MGSFAAAASNEGHVQAVNTGGLVVPPGKWISAIV